MLIIRAIFAVLICVAVVVTAAPATPDFDGPDVVAKSGCCSSQERSSAQQPDSSKPCHTTSCVMQCCRLLPQQPERPPVLEQTFQVVRAEPLPLVTLHTLTDPDAIFHPPKA